MREILLVYTKYFFDVANRKKYLYNQNDILQFIGNKLMNASSQYSHQQILKYLETKLHEKHINKINQYESNPLNINWNFQSMDSDAISDKAFALNLACSNAWNNTTTKDHTPDIETCCNKFSDIPYEHQEHDLEEMSLIEDDDNVNIKPFAPFSKLNKLLISQILSFNEWDERIKASQTCHLLFAAANEQLAKYHLKINKSMVYKVLIKDEDVIKNKFDIETYKNFRSIHLASLYNGADKKKRLNFINNLRKLLHQSSHTMVKFHCEVDRQYSAQCMENIQQYITNITALTMHNQQFDREILQGLHRLHVTQNMDLEDIQHLWINEDGMSRLNYMHANQLGIDGISVSDDFKTSQQNNNGNIQANNAGIMTMSGFTGFTFNFDAFDNNNDNDDGNTVRLSSIEPVQIENGDIDIACYLLPSTNYSRLTHLSLDADNFNLDDIKSDGVITPHPFFWLWNISTLQYCSLNMTLPIAKVYDEIY